MLYISSGDAADPNPPDPFNTGQDVSDLLSSILRIDVDRRDANKNYAIPADNPFVDLKEARPEVWAYGFRNPWRMSFDRQTKELFVGDVGWELWEMVHRVQKGGNYGWSATEGSQPIKTDQVGPTPIHPPLIELPHTIACSVTGGLVYRGSKFPELHGAYVFGDWETRRLWAARFAGDKTKEMPEIARPSVRIVAFGEDREGELYFLDHDNGQIYTLEQNDAASQNVRFPTRLSETGLFASVEDHEPAAGVQQFQINSRQWQDGATAEHLVALPETSSVAMHAKGKPIPGLVSWHNFRMHFPKDAVLARTLSLAKQRVETQMLHYDGLDWRAYTFAWRDDQTDADLVPADGADKEIIDGKRKVVWQFQSRSQCMSCHSNQSEYALAFLPEQLNRDGLDGRNQLVALTERGFIHRVGDGGETPPPFNDESAAREPKLANPTDEHQPLDARARSYLHANCNHCHSDGGGGSVPLRMHFSLPVADMKAVDVRPTRGDFGLPSAAIIKPGAPGSSTLYFRMAKFGRDRMPHIGSERPDEEALTLIEKWIARMQPGSGSSEADPNSGDLQESLANPTASIRLARKLGRDELNPSEREAILTTAAKLPPGPIRELFDGYLPVDDNRKVGMSARPRAILALGGDAHSGEKLYWSQSLNCSKCHRLGTRGADVGPDLSTIGDLRSPAELLESLLSPSVRVEPRFASYLILTTDGRSLSGLLTRRNDKEVVLRDSEGKEVRVPAEDVEQVRPIRASLMPDGQMAGLTPQEVADLLKYLTSCRTASQPSSSE
jgi:putative heme-binding domain-containing protein